MASEGAIRGASDWGIAIAHRLDARSDDHMLLLITQRLELEPPEVRLNEELLWKGGAGAVVSTCMQRRALEKSPTNYPPRADRSGAR